VGEILKRVCFFCLHERQPLYLLVRKELRRRKILRKHHPPIIEHIVADWIGSSQAQSIQNEDRWGIGGEGEFLQERSPNANLSYERTHVEHNNRLVRFAQNWKEKVLSQFGDSTAINYRTHIRKHLVPFFGEYPMKDLNPEMVQQFVSSCLASAKTTRNICITLQSMWTTAKAWGYVAHNLMEGVVLPDVKRVQRFFLSNSFLPRRKSHTAHGMALRRKLACEPASCAD
jgi:integrase-like protein